MKNLTNQILLFVILLLPLEVMAQSSNPDLMKMQADLMNGDFQEVISGMVNTENSGELFVLFNTRGKAYTEMGMWQEAVESFKKADEIYPGKAALNLARVYKKTGDKASMFMALEIHLISDYKVSRKEIMLDKDFADLDNDRDWIGFWSVDRYSASEKLVSEAEYRIKERDLDERFWEPVLAESDNPVMQGLSARYYEMTGDRRKADKAFTRALELAPGNISLKQTYAEYLLENEKFNEALTVYEEIKNAEPYNLEFCLDYILILMKSGKTGRALNELNNLEDMGVDASGIGFSLASELIATNPELAIDHLTPVLNESPTTESFNLRAKAYTTTGRIQLAINDFGMSLDINPRQADVYFDRALLRLNQGDREGACYDWKHALQLNHRKAADMLYKYCK